MEDFDQPGLPVDMVHVLCVLTATSSFVPAKTPLSLGRPRWGLTRVLLGLEAEVTRVPSTLCYIGLVGAWGVP